MNELVFVESIKVLDGTFYNLPLHEARLQRTTEYFFNTKLPLLLDETCIPVEYRKGMVKCRVIYSENICSVHFESYKFRTFRKMKVVEDEVVSYEYKTLNKDKFNALLNLRGDADDILIVKYGMVTDASSSNVVFENDEGLFTPSSCLLRGTKRQLLLDAGIIKERDISLADVNSFSKIYLINAMINLEDDISIPIENLII